LVRGVAIAALTAAHRTKVPLALIPETDSIRSAVFRLAVVDDRAREDGTVKIRIQIAATILLSIAMLNAVANADDIFIYPTKGQSAAQQDKDRYECHRWAVSQTGFDPSKAQPERASATQPQQYQPTQPHVVKGAARGALLGTVGGAIGGNAGKGAAIGAATGATAGGLRRMDDRRQQAAAQQRAASDQAGAANSARNQYYRAIAACLEGRGYSVK
jgi:hypothetical protein